MLFYFVLKTLTFVVSYIQALFFDIIFVRRFERIGRYLIISNRKKGWLLRSIQRQNNPIKLEKR